MTCLSLRSWSVLTLMRYTLPHLPFVLVKEVKRADSFCIGKCNADWNSAGIQLSAIHLSRDKCSVPTGNECDWTFHHAVQSDDFLQVSPFYQPSSAIVKGRVMRWFGCWVNNAWCASFNVCLHSYAVSQKHLSHARGFVTPGCRQSAAVHVGTASAPEVSLEKKVTNHALRSACAVKKMTCG